jgi:hypothetical protein
VFQVATAQQYILQRVPALYFRPGEPVSRPSQAAVNLAVQQCASVSKFSIIVPLTKKKNAVIQPLILVFNIITFFFNCFNDFLTPQSIM